MQQFWKIFLGISIFVLVVSGVLGIVFAILSFVQSKKQSKENDTPSTSPPDDTLPTTQEFALEFINKTPHDIKVYADDLPMCSSDKNAPKNCPRGATGRSEGWDQPYGFMYISSYDEKTKKYVDVLQARKERFQILKPNQKWKIVPPIDSKGLPFWCFDDNDANKSRICPGVGFWVVNANTEMGGIKDVSRFEVNVNNGQIWYNGSAVDGQNIQYEFEYTKPCINGNQIIDSKKVCNIPLGDNVPNGCPRVMDVNGTKTCPAPKSWSDINTICEQNVDYAIDQECKLKTNTSTNPTAQDLAGCPWGDGPELCKKLWCHKWYVNNPCAKEWLKYLQENPDGTCDVYGWAYDEKRYHEGDTIDKNYNPGDNTVEPLKVCNLDANNLGTLSVSITGILM